MKFRMFISHWCWRRIALRWFLAPDETISWNHFIGIQATVLVDWRLLMLVQCAAWANFSTALLFGFLVNSNIIWRLVSWCSSFLWGWGIRIGSAASLICWWWGLHSVDFVYAFAVLALEAVGIILVAVMVIIALDLSLQRLAASVVGRSHVLDLRCCGFWFRSLLLGLWVGWPWYLLREWLGRSFHIHAFGILVAWTAHFR